MAAAEHRADRRQVASSRSSTFETVIVGGGQAGLAVGYHLAQRGRPFVILDANERVGDSWRTRAGTRCACSRPPATTACPGCGSRAPAGPFPTKDEMADYLEAYAARFELPVRSGRARRRARRRRAGGSCSRRASGASRPTRSSSPPGPSRRPRIPAFAPELDRRILQLHSSEYRNPSQLRHGGVLVVGAGQLRRRHRARRGRQPSDLAVRRAPRPPSAEHGRARPGGSRSRSCGSSGRTC